MTKPKPKPPAVKPSVVRRVDPQKWAAARVLWERDVSHDFKSIGEMLGCSRQRVQKKATEDGWRRTADMKHINELAQAKADAHFTPAEIPGGEASSGPARPPVLPSDATTRPELAAEERSADLRKGINIKHRNGWRVVYGLLNDAVQARNMDKAKLAKVTAETLKITQDGERKAWGMDTPDPQTPSATGLTITIEREEAKRG